MRFRATEVQQRLFAALVKQNIPCAIEVSLPATSKRSRSRWFRADIVVYHDQTPILVIECKQYSGPPRGVRQRENYEGCGIPALWCGSDDIDSIAQAVAQTYYRAKAA